MLVLPSVPPPASLATKLGSLACVATNAGEVATQVASLGDLYVPCTNVLHTAEAHRCVSRSIAGVSPAGAGRQINPSRHLTPTVPTAEETEGPGLSSYPDC